MGGASGRNARGNWDAVLVGVPPVLTGVLHVLQAATEEQLSATNLQNGYKKTASELGISDENEVDLSVLPPKFGVWEDPGRLASVRQVCCHVLPHTFQQGSRGRPPWREGRGRRSMLRLPERY